MAKYSDKDLHWITVHPNGKEEKPGVKVALNGAGKVVKGPKGLKEDINAEGGLPGAKSLPLDELKKQKGQGGVGGAGGGAGAEEGENAFAGLTDALGGLLDDGEGSGEVGVTAPADAASSLLDDEPMAAGGGSVGAQGETEKQNGSKMCENAQKWFAQYPSTYEMYLEKAGSQEGLEEVVASTLADDDFVEHNGKPAIKSESLAKLLDAIEAAKNAKAASGGATGGESVSLFTDEQVENFVKNHYGAYGSYGSEEDKQLLKEVIAEHPEWFKVDLWNGGVLEYSSLEAANKAFGLVDEKKLALEQAKKNEGQAKSEPQLCPKAQKWLASVPDEADVWVAKFGSEEAFKKALSELDDGDFSASLFDVTLTPDGWKKLDAAAQTKTAQTKAGQTSSEKPQLGYGATKFIDEKGPDYKLAISTIQKKFGCSESEAEAKLAGYLAEIGEDGIYAMMNVGGKYVFCFSSKGDKALEAAIEKDAAEAKGAGGEGPALNPKAEKWLGTEAAGVFVEKLTYAGLTEDEAKEKLKEIAATIPEEDYDQDGYPNDSANLKVVKAINALQQEHDVKIYAENWVEHPGSAWCHTKLELAGFTEEEATEKLKEIFCSLHKDDLYPDKGTPNADGVSKILDAVKAAAAEKKRAGGTQQGATAPSDVSQAPLAETWAKSDYAKEHYLPEVTDALGLEGPAAEAKLAEIAATLGNEDFNPDGTLTWSGGKKIMDAIEKEKAEKSAAAAKVKNLVKKNKLCKKAAEFLTGDDNGVYSKSFFIDEVKDKFGVDDGTAEDMLAQALSALNGKNFDKDGELTNLGANKLMKAINAMANSGALAGAAQGGAQVAPQPKLCGNAQKWLDENKQPSIHDFLVGTAIHNYGAQDESAAKQMIAQAMSGLKDSDFEANGELTADGFNKLNKKLKKVAEQPTAATTAPAAQAAAPAAPAAKPLPPPAPAKTVSPELTAGNVPFPKDEKALSGLTKVKALGGASGAHATLYKDADGNMFVMKRYAATDKAGQARLKEECDADAFYLSGGANVPHFRLYGDEKSGYTKLSQYIPGTKTLGEVWQTADKATKDKITQNLRKDFALDVMAGAWDVLGTGRDNILVDGEGNVWRCDNGGAFNRRAQGGEKDEASWASGHIDDLWTMRGMSAGLDGKKVSDDTGKAEFFGGITTHQLLSDIVTRDWDKMTAHLPEATRAVMAKRIANAKEYHAVCDNVVVDGMYGDGQHSEDITLNYHCLNKFGARAGCVNKNIGPHNWGWCRGDGNGNPAPKLEDFTKAPEPTLEQFLPSKDKGEAAAKLLAAGKTINHHLFDKKDGTVNKQSVEAALALKPSLEAVANEGGKDAAKAKEMLAFLDEVQKVKDGGYKELDQKFGFAPSGAIDLNTAAAKAEAQAKFAAAHKEWQETTKNAQAKYAAAKKKWEKENGGNAFKWKNLTDCFEDFCKQNGIESSRFWEMAKGQGWDSQKEGSCRMKVLEILSRGGNLDHPYTSVPGMSSHSLKIKYAADEYKKHPDWLAKDMKAYLAMKSLTQMLLHNSTFANKVDGGSMFVVRTEDYKDVIKAYKIKPFETCTYPCGTHESVGYGDFVHIHGTEAMAYKMPFSRISSISWLLRPDNENMYLGDDEGELGADIYGIPSVYIGSTSYKYAPKYGVPYVHGSILPHKNKALELLKATPVQKKKDS